MKKLLILMFVCILLVGTVSALDFLPVKQYDDVTQTVTIVNTLGLGRDISTIQLNTPLEMRVGAGYQKVAEFEIDLFDDTYTDAFEKMDFYNLNNEWQKIERSFDYKYKTTELIDVNDYKEVCSLDLKSLNGTKICENVIVGTHQEEKEVWKDFETKTLIKGKVTIGIFTEVQVGDKVEWIPTLFGKTINEFASWTFDLNTNLVSYWKLDETTGTNVVDSVGIYNGTAQDTGLLGYTGIIDKCFTSFSVSGTTTTNYVDHRIDVANFPRPVSAVTVSSWIYYNATDRTSTIVGAADGGAGNLEDTWRLDVDYSTDKPQINIYVSSTLYTVTAPIAINTQEWYHVAFTYNGSSLKLYVNGEINGTDSTMSGDLDGGTGIAFSSESDEKYFRDGYMYSGKIDEVGIWNRSLSADEITQLYNGGTGITYTSSFPPTITLNTPENNFNTTSTSIDFNGTISDFTPVNVSLIINNVYIETNTSGILGNYLFTKTLDYGDYNWTYESCNTVSCVNGTTRNLTISSYIEEGIFYNSTSYETQEETFTTNITTNGTQTTSAEFFWNGVSKGASTKTGTNANANFSNTIQIPLGNGSKEFYWKVTLGATEIDTTKTNQTVNETVFTYCNASYTTPFLNVSFKDEADDSVINATIPTSNFIYYLGDGTVTKTYTYINSSDLNYYYRFCATPNLTMNVDPYIQYKQGADYPQRIYDAEVLDYTNTTTDLTLYLLGTADGIYVTFQVINSANSVLSGVEVTAVREISGDDVQVGIGTTGADGGVTIWLNPDFEHDFTFTKSGFTTYETSFSPTQSAYTITLSGGDGITDSYFRGIISSVLPTDSSLTNDTAYDFGFYLTSSFWDLTSYGFDLRLNNGTIITGDTTTTSGTQLTKSYNTNNQTIIYLDYYWLINETYTNGTARWIVYNTDKTQWSISTFFDDFTAYMDSGFFGIDDFGRYLIIFIVIFFTIGIMSYKFGFTSPINISVMTFLIVFFFDVVIELIPTLSVFGGNEVEHLLTFVTGLIMVMLVMREFQK